MGNYSNAYTEVYTILNCLDKEELKKIPQRIYNVFEQKRNRKYDYKLNEDMDLEEQEMMIETRAILFNLFRDYLATNEQKEKILKWQQEEREKNEQKKREKYNPDNLFKNKEEKIAPIQNEQVVQETAMLEYDDSLFTRIKNWFKKLFGRK